MGESGWFTFGYSSEGYILFQFLIFFSGLYILYIPLNLLGDYLEYSDLDINTSFNVNREKVEKRLLDYTKSIDQGKIQATLVDLYKMAEGDGETWSQLGEFYPDWSIEEIKLFITMLEELNEK